MNSSLRYCYDDGADLALILARLPQGWAGMRNVGLMRQLSKRQTPVADAMLTARWEAPQPWTRTAMGEGQTYLRSVLHLAR